MSNTTLNAEAPTPVVDAQGRELLRPELLAPAGDWECARAAVENGADAIYFGLSRFNARMRAHNFSVSDLPDLMAFLHRRGVKGYVTFNTLIFQNELADAEQHLRTLIAAGVDAAIVQDIGICRLIRKLSPDFPIHASTQMTITSAAGVEFARKLGCHLVVLARECSIAEIAKMKEAAETALPLEVFVHGALCVAYSGQCLTSEALGGRSANRGECAQACRMPYELISDGQSIPLGDRKYLLSPQDLAGLEVLPDLIRAGVTSLKIEGRLKSPEYVANITRTYRETLHRTFESMRQAGNDWTPSPVDDSSQYALEMAFSRGLYTGWLRGNDNQKLVHARFGKKRGFYLGEVTSVRQNKVVMRLEGPLKAGDGIVFDAGHPEEKEEGGRVYTVTSRGEETVLTFGDGAVDFRKVHVGDKVWKTSDPELDRQLKQTYAPGQVHYSRPLHFELHGSAGHPLHLIARDDLGNVVRVLSQKPLELAQKRPLTTEFLREQLGRLGDTPFELGTVDNRIGGAVILPVSELNRLRREAASLIEAQRAQPKRWTLHEKMDRLSWGRKQTVAEPELIVLVRNLAQLQTVLETGVETVYCEFEDPKKYREAVALFRKAGASGASIYVAPPRIFKMGEEWILKIVESSEPDGFLARNYDHLRWFRGKRMIGDFSLNVANGLTAEYLVRDYGLERVTASYDLNAEQLDALLTSAPPEWFEVTIHQHMPMFHMEHCIFCAFLSKGKDFHDCGRPCEKHEVKMRDRVGAEHVLKADAGCRNTLFNSRAQTGAEYVSRMIACGARKFRIEFMNENPEAVRQTIHKYRQLLEGEITGGQLWRELRLQNQLGVTRGQMERGEKAY